MLLYNCFSERQILSPQNGLLQIVGMAAGATVAIAGATLAWRTYQYRGIPPGPNIGILGRRDVVKIETFEFDLDKIAKEYGDVFSVQVGSSLMICLANHQAIKDALVKQGDTFAYRSSDLETMRRILDFKDDIFSKPYQCEGWNQKKTAIVRCLRGAGFSQSKTTEEKILLEIEKLFHHIKLLNINQTPTDMKNMFPKLTLNLIFQILFSKHFEYNDPMLEENLMVIRQSFYHGAGLLELDTKPRIIQEIFYKKQIREAIEATDIIRTLIQDEVDKHIADFNPDNPRDFVDNYLLKFGTDQIDCLLDNVVIILPDSVDTLSFSFQWALLYLASHVDIQERVAREIYDLTSASRGVIWSDRSSLPFTEATLREVMRLSTPIRTTVAHSVIKDTMLHGYRIPKFAAIYGLLYTAHRDPRIYKNPEEFNPERFLDADGFLLKSDSWIPFSMGRRMCVGEKMAQIELFMVISNFIQMYDFRLPEGVKPDFNACLLHFLSRPPESCSLVLKQRIYN